MHGRTCRTRVGTGQRGFYPSPMPDSPPAARPPSIAALFGSFFLVGILGFGGVLPLARRTIVEQRRWLSAAEFTDLLSLCQFLPGANITNLSIALGGRWHGPIGSLVAVTGLLAAPVVVVIGLGAVYLRWRELPVVAHAFEGLAAAASGLVLATAIRIAGPLRTRPRGVLIAVVAFVALALLRLPLLWVMLALVPASIALNRRAA
jgi:chromate transporter